MDALSLRHFAGSEQVYFIPTFGFCFTSNPWLYGSDLQTITNTFEKLHFKTLLHFHLLLFIRLHQNGSKTWKLIVLFETVKPILEASGKRFQIYVLMQYTEPMCIPPNQRYNFSPFDNKSSYMKRLNVCIPPKGRFPGSTLDIGSSCLNTERVCFCSTKTIKDIITRLPGIVDANNIFYPRVQIIPIHFWPPT